MNALLHPWLVPVVLVAVLLTAVVLLRRARGRGAPDLLLAHADRLTALPAHARARRRHRVLLAARLLSLLVAVVGCAVLLARPVDVTTVAPDSRSRDVVLCLDVSSSMSATDAAVVDAFARIARDSPGDRVGLVLFASRPVQAFPLTDDASYVADQLARVRAAYATGTTGSVAWAGTTGGDGTSVIGDGAATCVTSFDRLGSPRARSVVLDTDNVVSGPQRVTIDQVGRLAVQRGVRLYALNPAELTDDATRGAAASLRAAAEASGGQYFPVSAPGTVPAVVDALCAREAARGTGAPQLLRVDDPVVVAVVVALAVGVHLLLGALTGDARRRWGAFVVAGLVAASVALVWGPVVPGGSAPLRSRDVDVYLVVDGTLSMAAQDGPGGRTRLAAVGDDVAELTRRYAGARFSTIVSTTTAVQTMPLTTDASAALTSVTSLVPSTAGSASGSDPRQASALLGRVLSAGARTAPGRAQLVFYFGDGESTSDRPSGRFGADGVAGGAVLGYGTERGGPMRESPLDGGSDAFVQDTRPGHTGDAVSHEDPATLRAIATELGVPFVQRDAGASFDPVVADAAPGRLRPVDGGRGTGTPLTWVVAGLLLVALVADGAHWWTRRRS
ncbi:VWA domain-containing protein [Kineococcus rhizosphaerae]|uniref:von Willebrand factor type A domain-containing protein n=1 Tax=Kineococcus rhizosphaerae TaxID=559628 RepID=A0A2T0R833_9ACTN|nr:VWA domain-containing protein [Kineococcus rhizosphaerae]PRY17327.1 von Willebrand factor type A domain-containing protein [Kineococcus rhizosphaerae]